MTKNFKEIKEGIFSPKKIIILMLKNTICQLYMHHTIAICLFYKTPLQLFYLQVLKYTTYNVLKKDHFKINQVSVYTQFYAYLLFVITKS